MFKLFFVFVHFLISYLFNLIDGKVALWLGCDDVAEDILGSAVPIANALSL